MKVLESELDEQFLIAAAQRDPSQFAELYEANFYRVYAFVARRVPSREDAQDLTAEVFHEALRNLARYQWRGLPFVSWLLGIAGNLIAELWRRSSLRNEFPSDEQIEVGMDPGIEQRAALYQLVEALPADQRLVIVRRFVSQKSMREIAHELGRSEGAIKQLQFRALQNLRMRMGNSDARHDNRRRTQ